MTPKVSREQGEMRSNAYKKLSVKLLKGIILHT